MKFKRNKTLDNLRFMIVLEIKIRINPTKSFFSLDIWFLCMLRSSDQGSFICSDVLKNIYMMMIFLSSLFKFVLLKKKLWYVMRIDYCSLSNLEIYGDKLSSPCKKPTIPLLSQGPYPPPHIDIVLFTSFRNEN